MYEESANPCPRDHPGIPSVKAYHPQNVTGYTKFTAFNSFLKLDGA